MKYLPLIFILAIVSCTPPQRIQESHNLQNNLSFDGIEKEDLFVYVNSWMVRAFQNREAVIQFVDKDAGKAIGKFLVDVDDYSTLEITGDFDIADSKIRARATASVKTYGDDRKTQKWLSKDPKWGKKTDEKLFMDETWDTLIDDLYSFVVSEHSQKVSN